MWPHAGQFFPAGEQGEAMNLINAKYGSMPGLKAYTHVSDQYAPFPSQLIPVSVSEAPYILVGLLTDAAKSVTGPVKASITASRA
jgi:TnpA family transposase